MDSQAQKVSQYEMEYKRVMEDINILQKKMDMLEGRLGFVCVPTPPSTPSPLATGCDKIAETVKAPIVLQLRVLGEGVREALKTLESIHSRLEV